MSAVLTVYTTAPSSHGLTGEQFQARTVEVGRWTEEAGHRGLLVYTDNSLIDPWAVAQYLIERTDRLVPLVAVQPLYMHPFFLARRIASIAHLYGRPVDLNLVTGGFAGHQMELGDVLEHDERYERLTEYGRVVGKLLRSQKPVTHLGRHYSLNRLAPSLPMPVELLPRLCVSGASAACAATGSALGALRLSYPHPIAEYAATPGALEGCGIRFGIIAREDAADAWREAHARFPADEFGERLHDVAAGQVESHWHQELSQRAAEDAAARECYWLYPFRAYKTFCPYLVGDYTTVGQAIARYLELGVGTIILDVPKDEEDLWHARIALERAQLAFAEC